MNITDIDDKILNKVGDGDFKSFIKNMEQDFWNDMDLLNIQRPNVVTR
jgi:cysteinyl-tRNA synthetase